MLVRVLIAVACLTATACSIFVGDGEPGTDLVTKRMFVSKAQFQGNLDAQAMVVGGLVAGDALCASAATDAGVDGDFAAWLSVATQDARDRLPAGIGWTLMDGETLVFESKDSIPDGPRTEIDRDELGESAPSRSVWTGTLSSGERSTESENCGDWKQKSEEGTPVMGTFGRSNALDGEWTDAGTTECNGDLHLYCFEI